MDESTNQNEGQASRLEMLGRSLRSERASLIVTHVIGFFVLGNSLWDMTGVEMLPFLFVAAVVMIVSYLAQQGSRR